MPHIHHRHYPIRREAWGKTTTAAALLSSLARRGARVLGVDLDPQGSLGVQSGTGTSNSAPRFTMCSAAQRNRRRLLPRVKHATAASNILLSGAELEFNRPGREYLAQEYPGHLEERYDVHQLWTPRRL
jgi:chromosome partitioning protein